MTSQESILNQNPDGHHDGMKTTIHLLSRPHTQRMAEVPTLHGNH